MENKKVLKIRDFEIPRFGFGTYGLGRRATDSILKALEVGYRHIDSADMYDSHKNIAEALKKSGIDRTDVFITTKVLNNNLAKEDVKSSVVRFLEELQTDYIDLLLIHSPSATVSLDETIKQFEVEKEKGLIRFYGVSNFGRGLMQDVVRKEYNVVNNQIEYHPSQNDSGTLEYCQENDISVTAYSPLGVGDDLDLEKVEELSQKYKIPNSHVILEWLLEKGTIVIPRSADPEHIEENYRGFENWLSGAKAKTSDL